MVLIIIVIILAVIALLPVGVDASYGAGEAILRVKIGSILIGILPKKDSVSPGKKKNQKTKSKKAGKPKKPVKKLLFEEILALLKLGLHSLERFRKKLSVDKFILHYTAASSDPSSTAIQFGAASAAVGSLIPVLERNLKIRDRDIRINFDFAEEKPYIFTQLTATIQIWELLYIGAAFGTEYLIWRSSQKKSGKKY